MNKLIVFQGNSITNCHRLYDRNEYVGCGYASMVFVPLQELFDNANKGAPDGYWLMDGVHPTAAGHELIKQAWLEGSEKMRKI